MPDKVILPNRFDKLLPLTSANPSFQRVITSGIIAKLVELLGHAEVLVVTPALRAVGNIVTGKLVLLLVTWLRDVMTSWFRLRGVMT